MQNDIERLIPLSPLIEWPAATSVSQIGEWLAAVEAGQWSWVKNTRCKYVDIKFDTRRGAYRILDRDGNPITFEELCWQYSGETPAPPASPVHAPDEEQSNAG